MAQTGGFPWQAESHLREPIYANSDSDLDSVPTATAPPAPALAEQPEGTTSTLTSGSPTKKVNIVLPRQAPRIREVPSAAPQHGRYNGAAANSKEGAMHLPHLPKLGVHTDGDDGEDDDVPATSESNGQDDEFHNLREGAMHVPVRTIPPWVRDADESDLDSIDDQLPAAALVARHNYLPATERPLLGGGGERQQLQLLQQHRLAEKGVGLGRGRGRHHEDEPGSRWLSFAGVSAYPSETASWEIASAEWRKANEADYSKEWLEGRYDGDDGQGGSDAFHRFKARRKVWYRRAQFTVLRNPFIPLGFRLVIITFALAALGLGATIYHDSSQIVKCEKQSASSRSSYCISRVGTGSLTYYRDPSGLMAVIVDAIAVVYSFYITYDEYFSKPLGLRPARQKVRLVLLDLFFIIFQSANLALSFSSLTLDEGSCAVGEEPSTWYRFYKLCERQRALSSVLLVSLVAWLLTFSVSVLRLVERIDRR